jgi:hypothetical protein
METHRDSTDFLKSRCNLRECRCLPCPSRSQRMRACRAARLRHIPLVYFYMDSRTTYSYLYHPPAVIHSTSSPSPSPSPSPAPTPPPQQQPPRSATTKATTTRAEVSPTYVSCSNGNQRRPAHQALLHPSLDFHFSHHGLNLSKAALNTAGRWRWERWTPW